MIDPEEIAVTVAGVNAEFLDTIPSEPFAVTQVGGNEAELPAPGAVNRFTLKRPLVNLRIGISRVLCQKLRK
jgi:hypothetical protein